MLSELVDFKLFKAGTASGLPSRQATLVTGHVLVAFKYSLAPDVTWK